MKLDNVTVVTYINKLGGTNSLPLRQMVVTIWEWCIQRNIFLLAAREGQLSSRSGIEIDEGSLQLDAKSPGVQSDPTPDGSLTNNRLIAFGLMKQLPTFYSWRADPEAQGADAFNQDSSQMRGFANLIWCLIARCLC